MPNVSMRPFAQPGSLRQCQAWSVSQGNVESTPYLIVAAGLGPFAGVLAKLFAEAVEAMDPRPVEGVRATGANALEEILHVVIAQVLRLWISCALYRFESSARSASVVGRVGAGGLGVILHEPGFRSFIDASVQAPIIVTFNAPADAAYDFPAFYRRVRDKGFILYPGKLRSVETFRVGCNGTIDP